LLGLFVALIGRFVSLTKDIRTDANVAAREVRSFAQGKTSALALDAKDTNLTPDNVGFFVTFDDPEWGGAWRQLNDSILFHHLVEVPVINGRVLYLTECRNHADEGNENCVFIPIPEQIRENYWNAYERSEREALLGNLRLSLEYGLWGFVGGFGVWVFCQLVLFAVRG